MEKEEKKMINLEGKDNDEFSLLGLDERKRGKSKEFLMFDYSRAEEEKICIVSDLTLIYSF